VTAAPVPLVTLEDVRLAFGTRVVLDGVSTGVAPGDRVGVVGRNGAGKSTLLDVLGGHQPVDGGRVARTGGLRVARLAQSDEPAAGTTVRRLVFGARPEHDWRTVPMLRDVEDALLGGLALDADAGSLSGGEARRVGLARALVTDADLLLLDEPTNHLDVEGVAWLAEHLRSRPGSLVTVTHDRWFLDAVCDRTWEVAAGRVHAYDGGYAAYVLARAERVRVGDVVEDRRRALVRKELAWLRRGPPARTSKPKFRLDAAAALVAEEPPARDSVELVRVAGARLGRSVLDVEDVSVVVGGRTLLSDVTWRLGPGERVGVVGANGAGKTTLLRLLADELAPTAGRVRRGSTVRSAYLSQDAAELPADRRAVDAVADVSETVRDVGGRELTATQLAERLGFTGERLWTRVGDLSGGERRRLQLLRVVVAGANVLLLDEPTNDLDVDTLTAVEDLLDGWAGTLVVVSHDRYFLERVCDTVVGLLGDGRVRDLPRGVDEYLELRTAVRTAELGTGQPTGPRTAGEGRAPREARKELTRIERRLARLGEEADRLHADLATYATDYARVTGLDAELQAVLDETAGLEERWLDLAEQVEADR
jgi:ABC transport system ATP-binding/permease protein